LKRIILFGAGKNGLKALKKYGKENVAYFCDNDNSKQGTFIEDIEVISFEKLQQLELSQYNIVITPGNYTLLIAQLEFAGINNFSVLSNDGLLCDIEKNLPIYKTNNDKLRAYANLSGDKELLEDVSRFKLVVKNFMEEYKQNKISSVYYGYEKEGHHYGNLNNLLEYAGVKNDFNLIYSPFVSHMDCDFNFNAIHSSLTAVVFSGDFCKKKIREYYPYNPVFTVGPYIHYAKGVYTADEIKSIKEKNGKTLLVYLPHSLEYVSRDYKKEDFIDEVLKLYSDKYNTFILCVYWADILDAVCDYAESKGFKIVTNGFRFDQRFNSRQKSLLEIADAVVGGDVGTHIGFAIHMNLPIGRVGISDNTTLWDKEFSSDIEKRLIKNEIRTKYFEEFYKIFDSNIRSDSTQKQWIDPYQGFANIRTPEYIKGIFEICKDIWLECNGAYKYYPESVFKLLNKYDENNDWDKYFILKESLDMI